MPRRYAIPRYRSSAPGYGLGPSSRHAVGPFFCVSLNGRHQPSFKKCLLRHAKGSLEAPDRRAANLLGTRLPAYRASLGYSSTAREIEPMKHLLRRTALIATLAIAASVGAEASVVPRPLGGPYVPETAPAPPSTIFEAPRPYGYYGRWYSPYYGGGSYRYRNWYGY